MWRSRQGTTGQGGGAEAQNVPLLSAMRIVLILALIFAASILLIGLTFTLNTSHTHLDQMFVLGVLAVIAFSTFLSVLIHLQSTEGRTESQRRNLKAAIDNISEGFVIYDKDERLVMCNESYRDLYSDIADKLVPGAKFTDLAQDMIDAGMAPASVMAPEDWKKRRIEHFRDGHGEFITQYSNGRWYLLRDRKLPDGSSVGIRTDITDIKVSEQALSDSERRYRDLVERAPVAVYVHRDGIVLYANTATAKILGYNSSDLLLGKKVFDLIHPDHHRLAEQRLDKLRGGSDTLPQVDMKFQRADGSAIYTEAQVSKVEFDGQPALESILRDVTARRRTERALMESELRYRTLFECAPDAMMVHDAEKIIFTNPAAAKMFGAPDERALFDNALTALFPSNIEPTVMIPTVAWGEDASIHQTQFQRLNGEIFDAEVVTTPTNYRGEAVFHTVIRDVTDRKMMDAAMAQNAKLASLGSMAAGLAHELSQPLNIMRFAAEGGLLKMSRNKCDDELHAKNYKLIENQAERMGMIMDNMRIFSRKDPGPMEAFDLALAVRNIAHLLRNPFRVDGIEINVVGDVPGPQVMGNSIQLEQVLLNLLKNARDSIVERQHTNHEAQIGRIEIDYRPHTSRSDAIITITDNGLGIDDKDLSQIFDPFYTTKDVGKGTGLGLSLSHEIITAMSGAMKAVNTPEGARFIITLPLDAAGVSDGTIQADEASHASFEPTTPLSSKKNRHVLVVEDEVEAARAMADYLTEEGFYVTTANDGHAGLEAFREFSPDIVITDIRMPGFSGTELIQALRDLDAALPIIAVTGHMGETESIDPGSGSPMVDVLKKPVSLSELSRKIGAICAA